MVNHLDSMNRRESESVVVAVPDFFQAHSRSNSISNNCHSKLSFPKAGLHPWILSLVVAKDPRHPYLGTWERSKPTYLVFAVPCEVVGSTSGLLNKQSARNFLAVCNKGGSLLFLIFVEGYLPSNH